jgi:hypothetical protein
LNQPLGQAHPGQAHAQPGAGVDGQQHVLGLVAQQFAVGHRAGGDDAHHLALYRPFSGDLAHLLTNGHRFAQLQQAAQIGFHRMEGHARHHHGFSGRLATGGEGDVKQPGGLFGIGPEHLVKIAHAVEHQRGRKLRLDGQVLGHHRRVALCQQAGSSRRG